MNLLSSMSNFITEDEVQKHIIKKYEFRSMDKELEAQIAPSMQESGIYTPQEQSKEIEGVKVLQSQLENILEQNRQIFQSVTSLQEQIQIQNQSKDSHLLEEIKTSAYQQGLLEGKSKMQEELTQDLEAQKERMVYAIKTLEEKAQDMQAQIQKIRDDLSVIALDLAREVIVKEVEENSAKIALAIANELLQPMEKDAQITLKVHPLDLAYLQEKLSHHEKITLQPDVSIGRAGVMILSAQGNFDGNILARYKNLKRSLLDEKDF